ncbi:hypothetical protein [Kitasatospora cathayae]|uniref:Uncharacterized protein n=1 Tax=Kitasatospora cathayae TaxID=3004092 RepID=A0ABY7QIN4_9ACTN|nr:hypothetical protein [Kitasatospora sp. HUAS 3-15]WBP92217.1 hypothetical protein O1G21_41145 [Kitasatospora sp. HUAS 3-15]
MVTHDGQHGPIRLPHIQPPASPPGGLVIPFRWLASTAASALVAGLIYTGMPRLTAVLIGTAVLLVPWLVVKAQR